MVRDDNDNNSGCRNRGIDWSSLLLKEEKASQESSNTIEVIDKKNIELRKGKQDKMILLGSFFGAYD